MYQIFLKNQLFIGALAVAVAIFFCTSPARAFIPNDPAAIQWGYERAGVYDAWDIIRHSPNVVVAIIDNGFDSYHPDLFPNVWKNIDEVPDNGIDDDANGFVDDVYGYDFTYEDLNNNGEIDDEEKIGDNDPRPSVLDPDIVFERSFHHATVVAGIIGAVGNNGRDGAGITWDVQLMNIKVTNANRGRGNVESLVRAIRYAVDNGAHIINLSLVASPDERIKEAVDYAYANDVVVVAAAGNTMQDLNTSPLFPICTDAGQKEQRVIGVSAIGINQRLAFFSNIGSECIDITAPGVDVSSTARYAPSYGLPDSYLGGWQGTSFGAPFVSGAAALVLALQPDWTPSQVYEAILQQVHRTPPEDPIAYQQLYGAGLLQIDAIVRAVQGQSNQSRPIVKITAYRDTTAIPFVVAKTVSSSRDVLQIPQKEPNIPTINTSMGRVTLVTTTDKQTVLFGDTLLTLPFIDRITDLAAGDIDGDGREEIVVIGATGADLLLLTVEQTGDVLKAIIVGRSDVQLIVGDLDGDAKDDIVTYDNGASSINIWDAQSRRKQVWQLPVAGDWQLVPTYKNDV